MKNNRIEICFNVSDEYVCHLSVVILSICHCANTLDDYIINVLSPDITKQSKSKITNQLLGYKNISVNFIDPNAIANSLLNANIYKSGYHDIVFNKLLLAEVFKEKEKILFLDVDLVILNDLAKLFYNEEKNKEVLFVVGRDLFFTYFYNCSKSFKAYCDNRLLMNKESGYFNTGVMLIYPKRCNEVNLTDLLIEALNTFENPLIAEQDIYNYTVKKNQLSIGFFDPQWNVDLNALNHQVQKPFDLYWDEPYKSQYEKSLKSPCVIHYAGPNKPWLSIDTPFADYYWKYAAQTDFFKQIFTSLIVNTCNTSKGINQLQSKRIFSITTKFNKNIFGIIRNLIDIIFPYGSRQRHILKSYSEKKPFKLLSRLYRYEQQ